MNYYVALGVPANADLETIRSSFRALARRYHPDAGAGSSREKFHQIKEAYETLSDPARRLAYDRSLGAHRPVMVRVEPMSARPWRPEPFAAPYPPRTAFLSPFDIVFDELVRSFEEDLFFGPWFRRW